MDYTLVTGGTGSLGSALIPKLLAQDKKVIVLCRKDPVSNDDVVSLKGDITQNNLGIEKFDFNVSELYHLAGVINLSRQDKDGSIWETNVTGTRNVIGFCLAHNVPHLYYCSTAFTKSRNPYERSKAEAENLIRNSSIPKVTIFKPSIVMGTPGHLRLDHLPQFAMLMARVHKRADLIRRKIEGTLHLPVLIPLFHFRGNSEGKLNVVPLDSVVQAMAQIQSQGTFWLTHDSPPTVGDVAGWMGEAILLKVVVAPDFNATPIELAFERLAAAFSPYLQGDEFPSDLSCPIITRDTIISLVTECLAS